MGEERGDGRFFFFFFAGEEMEEGREGKGGGCLHCLRRVLCPRVKRRGIDLLVLSSRVSFTLRLSPFTSPSLNLFPYLCCCWDQFS